MKRFMLLSIMSATLISGCTAMGELAKTGADLPLLVEKLGLGSISTASPNNSKLGINIDAKDMYILNTKKSIPSIHASAKEEISAKFTGINWIDNRTNNRESLLTTQPFNVKVKDLYNLTFTQNQTFQAARVVIAVRAVDNPPKNFNSAGIVFLWQGYTNNQWVNLKSNLIAEKSFLTEILN